MYVRLAFAVTAHLEPEILVVDEVLATARFNEPTGVEAELKQLARKISKAWAEVLAMDAPVDTGALRKAIKPVDPDDPILTQETDELDTLELER
jgi:hypothetical protein